MRSFLASTKADEPIGPHGKSRQDALAQLHAYPNHAYVTRLQAKGVPLETIARLVGHADLETTGVYLHLSGTALASEDTETGDDFGERIPVP